MQDSWLRNRIRQVHIDFHMPEFPKDAIKNFDAKVFVGELKRAKVNVAGVFTKCHFGNSFYNTMVGHKHKGLSEDFFGQVLEEAHKNDIKIIAYYSLGTDEYAVKNNPDWYQIDKLGNIRSGNGSVWNLPCINSPYREELVLPQIREITENYDIDGYLLDIPYNQDFNCFCMYCKRKFKNEYGMELTPELMETHPQLVKEFNIISSSRCMQEIHDTVKKIKPHVLITCNGAWKMGEPMSLNRTSDYGLWESQPACGTFLCHSFKTRYTRKLDVPVQIMTVRFTEDWGLMSCKTSEQLKYEFAAIMSNGGIINIGDQVMPNGCLQSGVYTILADAFSFVENYEEYSIKAESTSHIALIANYTSNWLWDKGDSSSLGAAKMLIEGHQQFDIFYNDNFGELKDYKIVILPETVELKAESINKIKNFVNSGGLLLSEGKATLDSPSGNYLLADVLGVDFLEFSPYRFAYMAQNKTIWSNVADIPQLLDGVFIKTRLSTAQTLSNIQWPCGESVPPRAFRHKMPPPGDVSSMPAISVNQYGKGKAIYFAANIFSSYWDNNHFWLKNIFNNCLDLFDIEKPYFVDASPSIEANMMQKDGATYLHLVNFQNNHAGSRDKAYYDPIERISPVYDINVKVKGKNIKSVTMMPEGFQLEFKEQAGYICFTVPKMHIYSVLKIDTE